MIPTCASPRALRYDHEFVNGACNNCGAPPPPVLPPIVLVGAEEVAARRAKAAKAKALVRPLHAYAKVNPRPKRGVKGPKGSGITRSCRRCRQSGHNAQTCRA